MLVYSKRTKEVGMCASCDESAYELNKDERYFSGLSFFEKYRYESDDMPEVDYSSANGDLLKEIQVDSVAKVVFDIAWLALAQKRSENPVPEKNTANRRAAEGIVMSCKFCSKPVTCKSGKK